MQRFQDLLTEAAQLKQQQLKQERKNFQALPEYLKSGLNFAKKYTQLRKQHYLVQQYISQKLKKQGNNQYMLQNYNQALSKYQQSLSIFRYIHATKYENLKDQDIIYESYNVGEEYKKQHQVHLVALYLNICSALTKMNKKEQAVHAAEQGLKISDCNAKAFYKKAQAYLQYINRDNKDIKLGFYYLNKAYELSNDQSILTQMQKIKKQLDEQRQKQKNWFKFMFDKSSSANNHTNINKDQTNINTDKKKVLSSSQQLSSTTNEVNENSDNKVQKQQSIQLDDENNIKQLSSSSKGIISSSDGDNDNNNDRIKNRRLKQQLDKFRQQNVDNHNQQHNQLTRLEQQNLQTTKILLKPYLIIPRDDRWLIKYQQDFIHTHGSKIYSILQLNTKNDLLIQFKSLLAKCLELKQARITPQRDQTKLLEEKITMYGRFIEWVKGNCQQGNYRKYVERYHVQTQWITSKRGLPIDEVYTKQELQGKSSNKNYTKYANKFIQEKHQPKRQQQHDIKSKAEQFIQQVRRSTRNKQDNKQGQKQQIKRRTKDVKSTAFKFKQQWEHELEEEQQQRKRPNTKGNKQNKQQEDKVPANIKAYLQNYDELPMFAQQKHHKKQTLIKQHNNPQYKTNTQQQEVKYENNIWSFLKTFTIIIILVVLFKIIF